MKYNADEDKIKLKCSFLPHRNCDLETDSIRSDSSTGQFLCIMLLRSLATLFHFFLSSADISASYLQSGKLGRDVYMRPPKPWTSFIDEILKLLKPAYGLVKSGRLWQLCIEEWLLDLCFNTIPGFLNSSYWENTVEYASSSPKPSMISSLQELGKTQ